MKDVNIYIRAFNPRDRQGFILKYVIFMAFEYKGVIKHDMLEVEAASLAEVRLKGIEYILYRMKEPCNITLKSLSKIKYNANLDSPLIKNIENTIKKGNHKIAIEIVNEKDNLIFKELKTKGKVYKEELIKFK